MGSSLIMKTSECLQLFWCLYYQLRYRFQISLLILREFKGINSRLFPLKSLQNHRFENQKTIIKQSSLWSA